MGQIISLALIGLIALTQGHEYCKGQSMKYNGADCGFNLMSPTKPGCFKRMTLKDNGDDTKNFGNYFDSSKDTIVFMHGWQPSFDGTFYTSDEYNDIVPGKTISGIKKPKGNNAPIWSKNLGKNLVMVDWKYAAGKAEVKDAEKCLHTSCHGLPGSIVNILADIFVKRILPKGYKGDVTIAGHSLGGQGSIFLTRRINQLRSDTVNRVSMLDHFFSNGEKSFLPKDICWYERKCGWKRSGWRWRYKCENIKKCRHQWTGEAGRNCVKDLNNMGIVIENHRTSATSSNFLIGDENKELNKMTLLIEEQPHMYGFWQLGEKHNHAFGDYMEGAKYSFTASTSKCSTNSKYVPRASVPTEYIKKCFYNGNQPRYRWVQRGGQKTFNQLDNKYKVYSA